MNKQLSLDNGHIRLTDAHRLPADEGAEYQLYFYGDIVSSKWEKYAEDDRCPQDVADLLNAIPNDVPLDIYINSGGGDVHAGIAIYHQLRRRSGANTVHIDGLAASIASVIAMAGDEIIMPVSAQMMIHKPWATARGNANDLRATADVLDQCQMSITEIYMSKVRAGVTRERIEKMMNAEAWMTGSEAADIFQLTVENIPAAAACASEFYKKYRNTPEAVEVASGITLAAETAICIVSEENYQKYDNSAERLRLELALMEL